MSCRVIGREFEAAFLTVHPPHLVRGDRRLSRSREGLNLSMSFVETASRQTTTLEMAGRAASPQAALALANTRVNGTARAAANSIEDGL